MKYYLIFFITLSFFQCINVNKIGGFYVDGRFLKDPNGEKIILRGVNEMFIWSNDLDGSITMPEIAKTGANTVRIVWLSDKENKKGSARNLERIISNCIKSKMIPIVELHGATGKWELLESQVDYWVQPEVVKVLQKHDKNIILNIANEVGGWEVKADIFAEGYKKAIDRIRETDLKCPIMIDASGWGQDIDILQATGPDLIKHDPLQNILLSVHMWWPADNGSKSRIIDEINESVAMNLPLVVGEFAPMGPGCKQFIDFDTILAECQKNEIGWLSWSWGLVNNGDCADMDMTSDEQAGKYDGLEKWGLEAAVSNENSIQNTAAKTAYIQNF